MSQPTTTALSLRSVLDAVPRKGAPATLIADKLNVAPHELRPFLDHLLLGNLVFMRTPFREAVQWVPTARAHRMDDADEAALTAQVRHCLVFGAGRPGGAR